MSQSEGIYSEWRTTNLRNDQTVVNVSFNLTRAMYKRFLDKVIAEGYTKQEALAILVEQYLQ